LLFRPALLGHHRAPVRSPSTYADGSQVVSEHTCGPRDRRRRRRRAFRILRGTPDPRGLAGGWLPNPQEPLTGHARRRSPRGPEVGTSQLSSGRGARGESLTPPRVQEACIGSGTARSARQDTCRQPRGARWDGSSVRHTGVGRHTPPWLVARPLAGVSSICRTPHTPFAAAVVRRLLARPARRGGGSW